MTSKPLAISLLLLVGCGSVGELPGVAPSESMLEYASDFASMAADRYIPLMPYTLREVPAVDPRPADEKAAYRVALCDPNTNVITVSQEWVADNPPWRVRLVVFHEMGHCALGILDHDPRAGTLMHWLVTAATPSEADAQISEFFDAVALQWEGIR